MAACCSHVCLCAQVTDASGASLASHCPSLSVVKLTKAMTDSTIQQLAESCPQLQEADLHR
jgi:bacterioferritin-associated ferredoxin